MRHFGLVCAFDIDIILLIIDDDEIERMHDNVSHMLMDRNAALESQKAETSYFSSK